MSSRSDDKKTDERRIITDGGPDTEVVLSHLPAVPETDAMRDWVRGFAEDATLTVDDVRAGLRWADHALVVRSVSDGEQWWYYLDGHGELQLFSAEPAGHEPAPARQLHAELQDHDVALAVELAADAPEPVQCGKEIVTDGGEVVTDSHGNEVPPELDGVDLLNSGECPNCGDSENAWIQRPAGYYSCPTCLTIWAGDPDDADIEHYVEATA